MTLPYSKEVIDDETVSWQCPKCKLRWKTVFMAKERGSWTLEWLWRCPECDLADYLYENGPRMYGYPIAWRGGRHVKQRRRRVSEQSC